MLILNTIRYAEQLVLALVGVLVRHARRLLTFYIISLPVVFVLFLVAGLSPRLAVTALIGLSTGDDLISFKEILDCCGFAWWVGVLLHIASWLIIPVIISLFVGVAYGRYQEQLETDLAKGASVIADAFGIDEQEAAKILSEVRKRWRERRGRPKP